MPSTNHSRLTANALMDMNARALFIHDDDARLVSTNEWKPRPAPRLYLGRTAHGNVWRLRQDLPNALAQTLLRLCADEPAYPENGAPPRHRHRYAQLLDAQSPIEREWCGPAYWCTRPVVPRLAPIAITAANADLLVPGFDHWAEDIPHEQPFMAAVDQGKAVAVCSSVRITAAACAAGVETLPDHRRRGHAANAVAGWAQTVDALGKIPFYSTSSDNHASQAVVAKRLGFSFVGEDFHIT